MSPLARRPSEWTLARAFDVARSSRARVTSVGGDVRWTSARSREAARHEGVLIEELPWGAAVQGLAFEPDRFDVVVAPAPFAEPLSASPPTAESRGSPPRAASPESARASSRPRTAPRKRSPVRASRIPRSMLLAAALMLGEGLGERRAAETLSGAVLEASATVSARRTWSPPASARRRASSATSSSRNCPPR